VFQTEIRVVADVARVSPQWSDWKKAMDEELKSLEEIDVWDVILKSAG